MKKWFVFSVLCLALLGAFLASAAQIKDSESEPQGFDGSSSRIVETYSFPGFKVIQFSLPVLSVYSYLLISNGEALLVDPLRDIAFYLDTAKKEGAKIKGVYLTHSHADFVAGHTEIVKALNVPIYQSHKSGALYPFKPLDEKTTVQVGQATLKFLETPGHTPDGMCCAVYGKDQPDVPKVLFTGDVLFVGSVGRPDLLEGSISAAWLASAMFDSWTQKLSKLPDSVLILPAHGAGSLCGTKLGNEPSSTIGKERSSNPYLKHAKRGEFVAALLQDLPEAPQYFKYNAKMNREGPPAVNWSDALPAEIKPSVELMDPEKYYVVDLRDAQAYSQGHIPNAVNIGTQGRFENWVGTMAPWAAKVVLVGNPEELKEGLFRLHRVGYTPEIVSVDSWKRAGLPLSVNPPIAVRELHGLMQKGEAPLIVDARQPAEWREVRIGEVLNLPLNSLSDKSVLLDPKEPLVVVCNSGYRSSLALGLLERKGFKKARSMDGGIQDWTEADLPVVQP